MVLPLAVRGRSLGAITLLTSGFGRRYDASDQALGEELARRIALAIDNARLYREAQDAIRARDEFLSIASHELRTPLTPLQLQVQSLRRLASRSELPLDRLQQKLALAERQVERLGGLVANLLDISRITGHRLLLELEEVDLAALVRDVTERSRDHLQRVGCTLDLRAPAALVGRWDPMRLEQVLTNLLSNAMKYGAGKPIHVEVAAAGGQALLTVRDEGIGIAPEDQRRIFQRFERAVSERHYGGFGLGLWICRQVVEAMGGSIDVQSALGAGATFTVRLPILPE
jgi:signal transduction histidine kinase